MQARGPVAAGIEARCGALPRALACAGLALLGFAFAFVAPASAQGPACTRLQFSAAVADAAGALRDLNAQNRPPFQAKLRALKDKRGWSHDEFLKEAAPLVQDARMAEYDRESGDYLSKIQSMGEEGAAAREPDCEQLTQLRSHMQALVASQKAKWRYMLERIDQELAK